MISFVRPEEEGKVRSARAYYAHTTLVSARRPLRERLTKRLGALHLPEQAWQARSPEFKRALVSTLRDRDFDIVHVEGPWMGQYVDLIPPAKVILDEIDVYTLVAQRRYLLARYPWSRLWARFEYGKCLKYELQGCSKADLVLTHSEKDRRFLKAHLSEREVRVIPIWFEGVRWLGEALNRPLEEKSILFLGTMRRRPNVEAALYFYRHIWPLILQEMPGARLYIVGSAPPSEIRALAQDARVIVTGYVKDIREYYARCAVFVAPILWGGGIIVKILNAMAAGRPAVTTSVGNESIGAQPEEELRVADSPPEFARKVVELLRDGNLWHKLSLQGREFIERNYNWPVISSTLERAYREIMGL